MSFPDTTVSAVMRAFIPLSLAKTGKPSIETIPVLSQNSISLSASVGRSVILVHLMTTFFVILSHNHLYEVPIRAFDDQFTVRHSRHGPFQEEIGRQEILIKNNKSASI